MDIRKRLTIRFSLLVISLFVLFSTSVYFFSSLHRKSAFYTRLKNRGITVVQLLDNVKSMDKTLLQEIDKNTKNALYKEVIYLYDSNDKLIYDNSTVETSYSISKLLLDRIKKTEDLEFSFGKNEALGFLYAGKNADYKVVISAYDELGFSGIESLELILLIGSVLAFSCSYAVGWVYSGSAIAPITRIMDDVDKITATALSLRLDEGEKQDEIERLAVTFNKAAAILQDKHKDPL